MTETATLHVRFLPTPYTFVSVEGFQEIWVAPEREQRGVYLWTIECYGAYLVNYPGKTTGQQGFVKRIRDEFKFWRRGRDTPVDIEAFKAYRRVALQTRPPNHTEQEVAELAPRYRIWLAPIQEDCDCCQVENTIVDNLRAYPAAFQFLGNRDKAWKYHPSPLPEVRFVDAPPLIGLTAPVPPALERNWFECSDLKGP